eukprot:CAMPEP_0172312478 /NCGR_PEP_ID=MMETSP1058-20130122/17627_1 /TAXON_ID=83371 /ORGANISM="Detonula confervacea, Strain CCMP 353" /LENGTH=596 /DNA_ID=CAMNT_0013025949 /DNA_START=103 /DNA_END=1893 /DNA_ORIENTATION=-
MTQLTKSNSNSNRNRNKQKSFLSSPHIKFALLAIAALLFLNLHASSAILRQQQQPSSSSLRKRPKKKQQVANVQPKQKHGSWQVLEQYEYHFENEYDYDESTYAKDTTERDSIDMDDVYSIIVGDEEEVDVSGGEEDGASDATDDGTMEEDGKEDGSYHDNNDGEFSRMMKEWGTKEKEGKIAWLMSFPNSGTSFTSLLIRAASKTTTATNYGMESDLGKDGRSDPIYDWSEEGPYWLHPPVACLTREDCEKMSQGMGVKSFNHGEYDTKGCFSKNGKAFFSLGTEEEMSKRDLPGVQERIWWDANYKSGTKLGKSGIFSTPPTSASIMTKTHCGSRCSFCPPQRYLETSASFLKMCLSGARKVPTIQNDDGNESNYTTADKSSPPYEKKFTMYHPTVVEKAVHLIRNPFNNLVSRFHHEQKEHKKKGQIEWTNQYSNDVSGFKKWCAHEDALYANEEAAIDWEALGYPADIAKYFAGVSCHAEFFRYVQWHVMALRAAELLNIPVLYVYYEDYSTNLKGSAEDMLDFLNLEQVGKLPKFDSNKDYSGYFTQEERASASDLMRRVVNSDDRGIQLLERYWVAFDFSKFNAQTKSVK